MADEYQVIGKSEVRKDAALKVCGATRYIADIPLQNTFYGTLVRSPHHHARICSIEISEALRQPDVAAILTSADIPGSKTFGSLIPDQAVLAIDEVRHIGEPVALVIAANKTSAKRASELVHVEYEPLPAVLDPVAALEPDAPSACILAATCFPNLMWNQATLKPALQPPMLYWMRLFPSNELLRDIWRLKTQWLAIVKGKEYRSGSVRKSLSTIKKRLLPY